MRGTQLEHWKPTYKTFKSSFWLFVVPFSVMFYLVKTERDTKEHSYRTGQVAYKDRSFKFN